MTDEPTGTYDWDYDDEPRRPKILWGRVVALGAFLIVAFLLGRATAPDSNADEVRSLRADLADARDEIDALQQQAGEEPPPQDDETPLETPSAPDVETYVVQPGDNLAKIAQKYYGDPSLDDFLAQANGIDDPTQLRVGTEIQIPEKPE